MRLSTLATIAVALIAFSVIGCETKFTMTPAAPALGGAGNAALGMQNAGSMAATANAGTGMITGNAMGTAGTVANGSAGNGNVSNLPGAGAGGDSMANSAGTGQAGAGDPQAGMGSAGSTAGSGDVPDEVVCPATSALQAGDTAGTIDVGGRTRNYSVHVPASYTGQTAVPLVTDWHGILFNNAIEQSFSGWEQKSDQEGFIVVFPDGVDTAWNVGWCCTTDKTVDDVAFARALVAKLQTQVCIDPKRVYAVGYSMGGGMSLKLGCDAPDLIAAIAPSAFDLMTENEWPCAPSRPITIIQFRSTSDPIVPYEGGPTSPPNGLPITVDFLGAEANFAKWSQLDGCTGSPTAGSNGCSTYSQCQGGAEVTLCTTQGGSHDYGDPNIAWEMLKKHPLP